MPHESRYLNARQRLGLDRLGDALLPGDDEFPSFSRLGCGEHVDKLLADERFDKPQPQRPPEASEVARDTIDALVALGYARGEAERLVQQVETDVQPTSVEEAIRAVFRRVNPAV